MSVPTTSLEALRPQPAIFNSILQEFRDPMATIRAASEMLMRASVFDPQIRRIARNVQGACGRMQQLLDVCDQYAERSDSQPADVRDRVARAVAAIRERARAHGVGVLQETAEGIALDVDRHRIEPVLVEVLTNALEVMGDSGGIEISAVWEPRGVWIQVRNTGTGIGR